MKIVSTSDTVRKSVTVELTPDEIDVLLELAYRKVRCHEGADFNSGVYAIGEASGFKDPLLNLYAFRTGKVVD